MHRSRRWLLALLVTVCAACGSDDDAQAVAALKSQIVANNAMSSRTAMSDEQASCIARGAVEAIGVDRLQGYGILDDDLEVGRSIESVSLKGRDADALAGVFLDCADAEKVVEDRLVARLAPDRAAARGRVARCVRETVTPESVHDILSQGFQRADPSAYASLTEELGACRA